MRAHFTTVFVLLGILGFTSGLVIDGCPIFGCRPSGSFSFYLQVPRQNASINWVTEFVLDPVPNALGCVSDSVNIVCPSNGPFSEDKGYMSLYNENGTIRWRDHVLHYPTLPLLDNYGDVTGSDGVNLVHYDRDGKLYPIIKCYGLKPMFSMQLVGAMYLLLVSEQGGLVVRDTNAIPVAEIFLNDTVQRTNGTFLPISQPVVNGYRFYLLTEFVPESDEFDPKVLNLQRLYAIDIHHRPADIMTIAWYYNFEMEYHSAPAEDTVVTRTEKMDHIIQSVQSEQNLLWDYVTRNVYVSLPPPYRSNKPQSFWAFRDEGNSSSLTIRSLLDVTHMATFEPDSNEQFDNYINSEASSLWVSTADSKLCLVEADGNISRSIDLKTILGTDISITSKLALVRENDTAGDILLFGATVTKQTDGFMRAVKAFPNISTNDLSFLVAVDTTTTKGQILWMLGMSEGFEVKGQLSGFSGAAYRERDQIIVYAENAGKSAKIMSIH